MTAINAVAEDRAAFILTDGAVYDAEGMVTAFTNKAITFPHLGLVLAVSGRMQALQKLTLLMSNFSTFEAAAEGLPDIFAELWDTGSFYEEIPDGGDLNLRLFIVGWSKTRKRGESYVVSTMNEPGYEAFSLVKRDIVMSPSPDHEDLRNAGILTNEGKLRFSSAPDFLGRMVDLQRQMRWPVNGDPDRVRHTVGGHAVLTVIKSDEISQRVVRHWETDVVGEKIQPTPQSVGSPGVAITDAPALSRQQRRFLERQQSKQHKA
jgi:hypothetical protein